MKSLEKPPSEKAEFAKTYKKEFEGREEEREKLFLKDKKPSEAEEKQTELKDFTEGGKFEERIKRDKDTKEKKAMEGKKGSFAALIGLEFNEFYRADDIMNERKKVFEEYERSQGKKGKESKIKKAAENVLKRIQSPERRKEKEKERVANEEAVKYFTSPENVREIRKTAMKKIEELKNEFKRSGLSEEEIEEIYKKVKEGKEADYKKQKEAEIKRGLETKAEKAKE